MKKNLIRIVFFLLALNIFLFPRVALMDGENTQKKQVNFVPQVTIPGSEFIKGKDYTIEDSTTTISKYVKAVYDYLLSIVGITAAIVLMVGGIMWLTAGGSSEKVSQAKSWISGSLTGMVLALTSYLILQTINPQLVSFTPTEVPQIKPLVNGCCQYNTVAGSNSTVAEDITDIDCYNIYTTKAIPKLQEITNEQLKDGYQGNISDYLGPERFDKDKRANYSKGICETIVYCEIYSQMVSDKTLQQRQEATVIAQMSKEMCGEFGKNGLKAGFYEKDEFWLEKNALPQQVYKKTCENREGSSCNNSDYIYCYCYGGKAYINVGKKNEPCGNDGGKCVPNVSLKEEYRTPEQNDMCENKDHGSRDCGSGLICCEPSGIWGGYNPGNNYDSW